MVSVAQFTFASICDRDPCMRVALVHDWLTGMRGGEKCLEVFCELFPLADLYTLVYAPEKVSATIRHMKVKTSFISQLPSAKRAYRYYLPLFPAAIERFELAAYDLVLSSSHCVAKHSSSRSLGARTFPDGRGLTGG